MIDDIMMQAEERAWRRRWSSLGKHTHSPPFAPGARTPWCSIASGWTTACHPGEPDGGRQDARRRTHVVIEPWDKGRAGRHLEHAILQSDLGVTPSERRLQSSACRSPRSPRERRRELVRAVRRLRGEEAPRGRACNARRDANSAIERAPSGRQPSGRQAPRPGGGAETFHRQVTSPKSTGRSEKKEAEVMELVRRSRLNLRRLRATMRPSAIDLY